MMEITFAITPPNGDEIPVACIEACNAEGARATEVWLTMVLEQRTTRLAFQCATDACPTDTDSQLNSIYEQT